MSSAVHESSISGGRLSCRSFFMPGTTNKSLPPRFTSGSRCFAKIVRVAPEILIRIDAERRVEEFFLAYGSACASAWMGTMRSGAQGQTSWNRSPVFGWFNPKIGGEYAHIVLQLCQKNRRNALSAAKIEHARTFADRKPFGAPARAAFAGFGPMMFSRRNAFVNRYSLLSYFINKLLSVLPRSRQLDSHIFSNTVLCGTKKSARKQSHAEKTPIPLKRDFWHRSAKYTFCIRSRGRLRAASTF